MPAAFSMASAWAKTLKLDDLLLSLDRRCASAQRKRPRRGATEAVLGVCRGTIRHGSLNRKSACCSPILNPDQGCFRGLDLQLVHEAGSNLLRMITLFRKFWVDETGATAIEYGLIAAGIALAIIATVNGLGTKLNTKFTSINTSLH
jgi:pilus assembly protein Flp/PilA